VKTVFRNVRVLTMDAAGTEHERASVHVEGGRIVLVDPADAPVAGPAAELQQIDGAGHLLMPGLVNAHFHSSVNHLKGSLDSLPLEIFMLFESSGLSPDRASPTCARCWARSRCSKAASPRCWTTPFSCRRRPRS